MSLRVQQRHPVVQRSHRKILLAGLILLSLSSIGVALALYKSLMPTPDIQGVLLTHPRPLDDFELVSHQGKLFGPEDLQGNWQLLSYGYTFCPDICPMTLVTLAELKQRLEQKGRYPGLKVLFYTVDPKRDSPEQLARYVPYFHPEFVGLAPTDANDASGTGFAESLGIVAKIDAAEQRRNPQTYSVAHGAELFLINPEGALQAVFKPELNQHNLYQFSAIRLERDYLAVRDFLKARKQRFRFWAE